ncbi:RNA-binding (RRM/RBD/RNP motifs) family protein [Arabidopsis thaliana]|uniref:RNA-binding (RRM/RBD/RNP motifs) family protein n=1 Tax=Arabidopsis thaliana TaxID=3702 RepID=Q8GWF5_ARATH|nr:RNA-binding (RRM/RBD/RNP motifs) family protein [Arabidopsis thaliana]AEE33649.1 RNA-binding (RRM/RBD/RNP motifs) family protein [Arabidopsis thaliana]BAC43462.1 unknown protein [Arabidopsis thaliana]|eukprot:NP_849831.1 RNA-binding (RRM/RBD/RNP motifs) family protein [Arabidopsis thaliana]
MAASSVLLSCFKSHHQPNLLHGCNYSSNQTLLRFNFSTPKPLLISSRSCSRRFRVLSETITVKLEDHGVMALYVTLPKQKWKPLLNRLTDLSWRVGRFE